MIFTIILFVTPSVFAEYQTLIVGAGDSESLSFYLKEGDRIEFEINVDGGTGDDINFYLKNPIGGISTSGGIVESASSSFVATTTGNHIFEFDNSFSYVSSKKISFIYDIIKRPIPQAIANTARDVAGGGCLIATATYGSEMSQQVQQLRELRDNQLLNTEAGTSFMNTFNDVYYSFSPYIADMERESPMFKEVVKISLTPMLSSLTIMENAESESEVISLGLSVIALNLGMYLAVPVFGIIGIRKIISNC